MNITSGDRGVDFVRSFYCRHVVFVGKMVRVDAEDEAGRWAGWLPLAAEVHSCPGYTLL